MICFCVFVCANALACFLLAYFHLTSSQPIEYVNGLNKIYR